MYCVFNLLIGNEKVVLKDSKGKLLINEERKNDNLDAILEDILNELSRLHRQETIGVNYMGEIRLKNTGKFLNFFIYTK